jgi:predicted ATPase
MRLHSIAYTEYEEETYAWQLDELSLIEINLIVGKNATGKSRVLRLVNGLARLIDGSMSPASISSGHYRVVFKDNESSRTESIKPDITYTVEIFQSKVTKEVLKVGGDIRLDRGKGGRGSIFFSKNNAYIDVQVPETNLASSARRDSQQHQFFEFLHEWANSVRYYESARTEVNSFTSFQGKVTSETLKHNPLQTDLQLITKLGKDQYGRDFVSAVIRDMRKIGYAISDFGLMPFTGISNPLPIAGVPQTIFVLEEGIDKKLPQTELSDGMLRALSTLIFLHFIRLQKQFGCILIDDIGEGLDFDRATKLISVVIEQAEMGHLQLVMTTNDRFVMNQVPLKYWSIMQRKKGKVSVFNKRNAAERFAEFEEFGFNNFDFFAKEFFSNGVAVESE